MYEMFQTPKYRCCDKASRTGVLILPKGFYRRCHSIGTYLRALWMMVYLAIAEMHERTCRWEDMHPVSSIRITLLPKLCIYYQVHGPAMFSEAVGSPCWKNDYLKCTTCPAVSNVQRAGATRGWRSYLTEKVVAVGHQSVRRC